MNEFTAKELIMSLACPFLSLLWGIFRFLDAMIGSETGFAEYFSDISAAAVIVLAAIFLGGALSALLTFFLKIHTERFLKIRLIITAAAISIIVIFWFAVYNVMLCELLCAIVGILAATFSIVLSLTRSNAAERAVIILSDPVVYVTLFYISRFVTDIIPSQEYTFFSF